LEEVAVAGYQQEHFVVGRAEVVVAFAVQLRTAVRVVFGSSVVTEERPEFVFEVELVVVVD
jgi:hypothetical protein